MSLQENLLSAQRCKEIITTVMAEADKLSKTIDSGVEAELIITSSNLATSRFAGNQMTQNQAPCLNTLSLRVLAKKRQARMSGEDLSDEAVKKLVQDAFFASQLLAEEPDLLPLPEAETAEDGKVDQSESARFDQSTAAITAADRALVIKNVIAQAQSREASVAGIYATGAWINCVGNSRGLFRYYRETACEYSVTASIDDVTGWAKGHGTSAAAVDAPALTNKALDRALKAKAPAEIAPGKYTTILEPAAVIDLLAYLWPDFAATSHKDKISSLLDKVGAQFCTPLINITDDAHHILSSGCPFDGEGLTRKRLELVKNGVLKGLVYGRNSARFFNAAPTGHGLAEPSPVGEYPLNLIVESAEKSSTTVEDMIASVGHGEEAILLTRVWYVREVDPATKLLTGMTRDGTFLVRDGQVVKALKNLRFNISLFHMLNNVLALGQSVATAGSEGFPPAVVAPMMIKDFNFTEVTRF